MKGWPNVLQGNQLHYSDDGLMYLR